MIAHDGTPTARAVEDIDSHLFDQERRPVQIIKVVRAHGRLQVRGRDGPSAVDGDDDVGQAADAGLGPGEVVHAGKVLRPEHVEIELFGIAAGGEHGGLDTSGSLVVGALENLPQDPPVALIHVIHGASVLAVVFEGAIANH